MTNRFDLTGRVVMVTGASSGLGHHSAQVFAEAGAKVAVAARRSDRLNSLVEIIAAKGGTAFAVDLDVADEDAIEPALDAVENKLGPIDVLFNNAGMMIAKPPFEHTPEDWRRVIDTNLNGAWFVAIAVAKRMAARKDSLPPGGGSIINTTSVGATITMVQTPQYVASKAGLAHLTRQMARELAPYRIRVNAIAPGMFLTEINQERIHTEAGKASLARIPLGRPGHAEDMAGALLLFASDAGAYISGSELVIDGGILAAR